MCRHLRRGEDRGPVFGSAHDHFDKRIEIQSSDEERMGSATGENLTGDQRCARSGGSSGSRTAGAEREEKGEGRGEGEERERDYWTARERKAGGAPLLR
jgi:hypothetical protein